MKIAYWYSYTKAHVFTNCNRKERWQMLDINVSYTVPKVEWNSFEQDKEQALQVVKDLESLEITENNLKESKESYGWIKQQA